MIAIIIVNWNGHRDTVECLEALMRLSTPSELFRIIISDNNSDKGSIENIVAWCNGGIEVDRTSPAWRKLPSDRRHVPEYQLIDAEEESSAVEAPLITIIRNSRNLGFAGGNNVGLSYALRDQKNRFFWLLNNDTICMPDALDALKGRMKANVNLGMLGSTLLYYDNPNIVQGLGGRYDGASGRGDHIGKFLDATKLPSQVSVEKELDYVIGAALMVNRDFLDVVGLMEERYFLYFEETDWRERNNSRFMIGWEPGSVVFHKEGSSIGTSLRNRPSNTSIYYMNINLLRFTWRFYRSSMLNIIIRFMARWVRFAVRGDLDGVRVMKKAALDFVLKRQRTGTIKI